MCITLWMVGWIRDILLIAWLIVNILLGHNRRLIAVFGVVSIAQYLIWWTIIIPKRFFKCVMPSSVFSHTQINLLLRFFPLLIICFGVSLSLTNRNNFRVIQLICHRFFFSSSFQLKTRPIINQSELFDLCVELRMIESLWIEIIDERKKNSNNINNMERNSNEQEYNWN